MQKYTQVVQEDLNLGTGLTWVTAPAGGRLRSTQVGIHSFARGLRAYEASWTPGAIAAGSNANTTVTVPDAAIGDVVMAAHSKILTNDLRIDGHVSASETVKVIIHNPGAASVTVSAGTVRVIVFPLSGTIEYDELAGSFTAETSGPLDPGAGLLTLTPTITGGSGNYSYAWSAWSEHGGSSGSPAFTDTDEIGLWTPLYAHSSGNGICSGEAALIVTDTVTALTLELGPEPWTWWCV